MAKGANKVWVGFDLGGTKMMATVYGAGFKALASAKSKTPVNDGPKAVLARIRETIHAALKEAKVPPRALAGIGVGCPGVLDLDAGIILEAPNLGWKRVPLRKLLAGWFRCRVTLANDVDAGTYGEYRFGAGRGARTLLGVFPGTGIGGGCVYDGKLLRGKTGSAMEIGHLPIREHGRLCGCGRRGGRGRFGQLDAVGHARRPFRAGAAASAASAAAPSVVASSPSSASTTRNPGRNDAMAVSFRPAFTSSSARRGSASTRPPPSTTTSGASRFTAPPIARPSRRIASRTIRSTAASPALMALASRPLLSFLRSEPPLAAT